MSAHPHLPFQSGGPTAEQRAMLAQQAMSGASRAPRSGGPTAEQRAMLAQQAMRKFMHMPNDRRLTVLGLLCRAQVRHGMDWVLCDSR